MAKRKKTENRETHPDKIDAETWVKIGRWVASRVSDMEVDAEQIAEEEGTDFMPALRGLSEHLIAGGTLADPAPLRGVMDAAKRWCAADLPFRSLPPDEFEAVAAKANAQEFEARLALFDAVQAASKAD